MSTDVPKSLADDERNTSPVVTATPDAPPLSDLQQAILARARETIARREAKPRKSRTQFLVVLAVTLVLGVIAFSGLNYVVATAQRLIAEYAASAPKNEAPSSPAAAQPTDEPGVIILQPDRTLADPAAPAKPLPTEPDAPR